MSKKQGIANNFKTTLRSKRLKGLRNLQNSLNAVFAWKLFIQVNLQILPFLLKKIFKFLLMFQTVLKRQLEWAKLIPK